MSPLQIAFAKKRGLMSKSSDMKAANDGLHKMSELYLKQENETNDSLGEAAN